MRGYEKWRQDRESQQRSQSEKFLAAQDDRSNVARVALCAAAIKRVMMKPAAGELTKAALLRNLDIARKLGCLDALGLDDMRHGRSPTVKRGPYKGDELSVDHIIPFAVVPELGNVIANLELMPLRMNQTKNSKVGERQLSLAEKFHAAALLSDDGLRRLQRAADK